MSEDFVQIGDTHIASIGREYFAKIPVKDGTVDVTFSEISRSRQTFSTVITIQLDHNKEGALTPFSQRIDLNSASAVTDLRRSLDGAFGKEHNWTIVLNKAANAVRYITMQEQRPVSVRGREYEDSPFLLKPFLQRDACNMVFGDSEVGKSYFCLYMAVCLASGRPFLGYAIDGAPKKTLYLDYEDSEAIFNNRLLEISEGLGLNKDDMADLVNIYRPQGSIRDLGEVISKFVEEHKYDLIIIDAGSNAAGGSPNDEQKVVDMFNALEQIPTTKLIIHHEPKQTDGFADNKAFYGSTFWRALTRVAWRLVLENEDDGKLIKAVIAKKSNLGKVDPILYTQKWLMRGFDYEGGTAPITCVFSLAGEQPMNNDDSVILAALQTDGDMTGTKIRELTGLSVDRFRKAVQRLKKDDKIHAEGNTRSVIWCFGARHESKSGTNGTNVDYTAKDMPF